MLATPLSPTLLGKGESSLKCFPVSALHSIATTTQHHLLPLSSISLSPLYLSIYLSISPSLSSSLSLSLSLSSSLFLSLLSIYFSNCFSPSLPLYLSSYLSISLFFNPLSLPLLSIYLSLFIYICLTTSPHTRTRTPDILFPIGVAARPMLGCRRFAQIRSSQPTSVKPS